jgi:hypothetical protein
MPQHSKHFPEILSFGANKWSVDVVLLVSSSHILSIQRPTVLLYLPDRVPVTTTVRMWPIFMRHMFSVLNIILNFDQMRRLQARLIELTVGRHVNLKTVNSLAVLVLCWFYVLSGRLFEMQRRRIGYTKRRLWPVAPKGETEATATGDINLGNASRTEPLKTTTSTSTSAGRRLRNKTRTANLRDRVDRQE